MWKKFALPRKLRRLLPGLSVALLIAFTPVRASVGTIVQNPKPSTSEAPINFWNRVIGMQRSILAGGNPQERAERASSRLAELPLNASADKIVIRPIRIEDQDGIGFVFSGKFLFFLGTGDLDKESGETLE